MMVRRKTTNKKKFLCVGIIFCWIIFTSYHQTFCSLFKVRRHVIGCINYDIVAGLCSELLMSLSYYIHLGCGLFLSPTVRLFAVYLGVRRHVIGRINHDIVTDLSSELLMRLSCCIRIGYSKKFLV